MLIWLDTILAGLKQVQSGGVPASPARPNINFDGVTISDDPANDATKITISGAVSSVSGAAPITSTGGAMPAIGITPATTSAPGSMSAADKTKLDGFPANSVGTGLTLTAGAGLTGGGDLTANRSFAVGANGDGSIIVNVDDIQVGALGFARVQTALGLASSAVQFNAQQLKGLADPTQPQDAETMAHVQALHDALPLKMPVVAIGTANIAALSGLATTVDGITFGVDSMRVGLTGQSASSQNGIWLVHAGAWTRPSDFAAGSGAAGAIMFAERGTSNAESGWACQAASGSDVIGSDNLHWIQFTGLGQVDANGGLTKSGNTLSIGANADGSIVVNADDIQVGILASDAQHGLRGGGTTHALAIAGGANGFLSGADKTKLDTLTAFAAIASVNGTAPIVSSGGTNPAISINPATTVLPGSMSASDKTKLDSMNSGASVSSVSGTAPIAVATGTGAAVVSIGAATGSVAGSMSAADKAKLDAAVSTAGASTLALRDASGNCAFAALTCTTAAHSTAVLVGTNPATTGGVRLPNALGVYERNFSNNADLIAHISDASDFLHFGDPTNGGGSIYDVPTGKSHAFKINSVQSLAVASNVVSIGTGTLAASGVVRLANSFTFKARNAANSADVSFLGVDNANNTIIGDLTNGGGLFADSTLGFNVRVSGTTYLKVVAASADVTAPIIEWTAAVTSPTLKQIDSTTPSATGQTMAVQAQNATGTTSLGGDLRLMWGTGTSSNGNIGLGAAAISAGGGRGVVFIANDSTDPSSNPVGGGVLYVSGGALKYRGSSGTVTTLAAA